MGNQLTQPHIPVMKQEAVSLLNINPKGIYLDCTVGFAGHSVEIIKKLGDKGKLIGIDYDPYALEYSNQRLSKSGKNFELFHENYFHFPEILDRLKIKKVDGILFDLGISSYQVDSGYRGFSYSIDAPLDMRFDDSYESAQDFINNSNEEDISNIIKEYGEEKFHRRIAKAIVEQRKIKRIETTHDLKNAIIKSIYGDKKNKTLSRVFQAIRIHVNNELENLLMCIINAINILSPGGRLAIITFHSLEDRLVKNIFKAYSNSDPSILNGIGLKIKKSELKKCINITKKPIGPSLEEIKKNKRARSAKLRILGKV